jgi:hypothetical protein
MKLRLAYCQNKRQKVRVTYGLPGVLKNIFQILGKMPWTYIYKAACRHCVFRHIVGMRRSLGHGATSNRRPDVKVGMRPIGRQLLAETLEYVTVLVDCIACRKVSFGP